MPQIFSEPPIVITYERLSVNQLLAKLRRLVSRAYMNSAVRSFAKSSPIPQVLSDNYPRVEHYSDFPLLSAGDFTGFFCFESGGSNRTIFMNIQVGGFQILVNLTNDEVLVRKASDSERFVIWLPADTVRISMDLVALDLNLESYL